jgi:hypothetical protein
MNESQNQQEKMEDLLVTEQAFNAYIMHTDAQHNAVKELDVNEQMKDELRAIYSTHNKIAKRLLSATRKKITDLI